MLGLYSFSGTVAELYETLVPAFERQLLDPWENVNEWPDVRWNDNVRPYSEVFDR